MFLNKYHHLKNKEINILIFLFLFSILIRIPAIVMFGDQSLENEWKDIVNNLIAGKGFLYRGEPNLFMPPLYAYYLYFFSLFNFEDQNYVKLILSSQILLSSIVVVLFYKLNQEFFSKKISLYSSILLTIFPLYIYSCTQISSISLQVFLTTTFLFCFFQILNRNNNLAIFIFSLVSGLLILLRGEFLIIFIFSIIYFIIFFKINIKKILLILLISFITVSPYMIRNIILFDSISITKSFGYNLWKGNNTHSSVEGSVIHNKNLLSKIENIPTNNRHAINLDKVYLDEAINNIKEEPKKYLFLAFKKFVSFMFININSSDPKYYNIFHYIPLLIVGLTSLAGIILSNKRSYKLNYLILIYFIIIIIFSFFFVLPRYKLAILPLQIIFTNILVEKIYRKFFAKQ